MTDHIQGFPLSPHQKRLWLVQAGSNAFCCQVSVLVEGGLDREGLRRALEAAVGRHGILRTTFRRRAGIRVPLQVVGETGSVDWREVDGEVSSIAAGERGRPWDWEAGPVLRSAVVTLEPGRHALVLTLPALCGDARSLALLLREAFLSADGAEEEEPVQFFEYSAWQTGLAGEEGAEEAIGGWRRPELSEAASPALPGERAPVPGEPFAAGAVPLDTVLESADVGDVSGTAFLLAAWQAFLWRLDRRSPLVVDVVVDGRKFEELRGVVGPVSAGVPVPAFPSGDQPFVELARAAEAALSEAAEWQEYRPFAQDSEPGRAPVAFEVEDWSLPPGIALIDSRICSEPFRLKLAVRTGPAGLAAELLFDSRVLDRRIAAGLAGSLRTLIAAALTSPNTPVGRLPLLDEEERRFREAFNDTARELPLERSVHGLFAEQAARTPDSVAAEFEGRELTYGGLAARAGRLAGWLRKAGVRPERLVAVCVMDPLDMLTALLGILGAGAAYLPLDPTYPRERLSFLLADSGAGVLLTERALVSTIPADGLRTLCLDAEADAIADSPIAPFEEPGPDSLAYVLYTSGSTGRPKGVTVPHRGLVNYLLWAVEAYDLADGEGAPVHSPLGFDLTVTSLFAPLLAGRRVVFVPVERGVEALGTALLERGGFSLVKLTPAHLSLLGRWLPGEGLEGKTRALVVGGEALAGSDLAFWRENAPSIRVFNEYGPTETVVGCCVHEVPPGPPAPGPVPIGLPVANARLHLLDPGLEPVPAGVAGEIFVGGAGVARGYLGRPDLTAERFVPDPVAAEPGARLYRTGDLARFRPDGDLEFLGRVDRQVKMRGHRVELEEIEAVLAGHPEVAACVVTVREDEPGDRRLAAYVVPSTEPGAPAGELLAWLRRQLPEPMIPAAFVSLSELPLDAHGKVDRGALPRPAASRPDLQVGYAAPETEIERLISEVWRENLRLDSIGIHDNFFDLGGDSFLMFQVHRGVARGLNRDFPVMRMFQHPTIHALAGWLARQDEEPSLASSQMRAESRKTSMQEQRRRRALGRAEDLTGVNG